MPYSILHERFNWRYLLLVFIALGTMVPLVFVAPIPQDQAYHHFADDRSFISIPNFFDVVSNLCFLVVGWAGVRFCFSRHLGPATLTWRVFFIGVTLVSIGSAYYHWYPVDATLVWDRLPITMALMALVVALLAEYIDTRLVNWLLGPTLLLGFSSVVVWVMFDDLRFYVWVQVITVLLLPMILLLFKARYSHARLLFMTMISYILAKLFEFFDKPIFMFNHGLLSGHTLKHVFVALGCYFILLMLQRRQSI